MNTMILWRDLLTGKEIDHKEVLNPCSVEIFQDGVRVLEWRPQTQAQK